MRLLYKRLMGLLLLGAATVGVGGLVVWQENRGIAAQTRKEAAQKLFSFTDSDSIAEVGLSTPNGTFELTQQQGQGERAWQLQVPMRTLAEASTASALVRAALDLKMTSRLGGQGDRDEFSKPVAAPADLTLYGLDPPMYTLRLKTTAGQTETLLVGKKNSYDGSLYVKRQDQGDVGVCGGSFAYQLDQDLFKLREKRPLLLNSEEIARLKVTGPRTKGFTLERTGQAFGLTAPFTAAADESQANQILGAITGLRAKAFVSEGAATAKERRPFGLEAPAYTVEITRGDGSSARLLFGVMLIGSDIHYFAMEDGNYPVIELAADWAFKKLGIDAKDLRDTHVLVFEREAVRKITISRGANTLVLQKDNKDADGLEGWRIAEPVQAQAQTSKVAGLLFKLKDLKEGQVVAEAASDADLNRHGLKTPELRVDLWDGEAKSLGSLVVGHAEGDKRYVTSFRHERISMLDKTLLDDISAQAADYQGDATAKSD